MDTSNTYTVKEGDTLSGIAEQFGVADYNTITGYASGNPDLIMPGEILTLPENQLSVSAGTANSEFSSYSADLTKALSTITPTANATGETPEMTVENVSNFDPYARMLDDLSKTSNASTQALIASIQASRMNQANSVNTQYDNYKRGLQLLGIQHNDAASTPDLLMGHITQAENEQRAKIEALDREEKMLIMDAEQAQAEDDLATLRAKMDRVEEIKAEKNQALKDIAEKLSLETEIAGNQAHLIYDTFITLDPSEQELFIQEVAKTYNIPLATLTTALADEKLAREEEASKGGSGSGTDDFSGETGDPTIDKPGQAKVDRGYSIPQDMVDVSNYIEANSDDPEGDLEKAQTDPDFFNYILALTP